MKHINLFVAHRREEEMSEQTIFLLRDQPIIEINPELLREHELSKELFGETTSEEYEALKEDIKNRGIQDPLQIVKQNGGYLIVSGHRRARIAKELGIKVPCIIRTDLKEEWQIKEALIKDNLLRRHLTDYQKVRCGLELEPIERLKAEKRKKEGQKLGGLTAGRGRPKDNSFEQNFSESKERESQKRAPQARDYIAKQVGFGSGWQYEKAKKVYQEAPEPIKKQWQEGKLSTHAAYQRIKKHQELEKKEKEKQEQYKESTHIEGHIVQGDAIELLDKIENASFDLLLTDPPYSTEIEDFKGFLEKWLPKAIQKIKDTGRVYIFTGSYINEISDYISVFNSLNNGFKLSNLLVWHYRNNIGPTPKYEYKRGWQGIFYLYGKNAPPLNSPLTKDLFDHFDYSMPDGRHEIKYHPNQKPEELIKQLIVLSTKRGDKILDLFAGSGTIGLAASKLGRYSLSIEKEPKYVEICKKRGLVGYEL